MKKIFCLILISSIVLSLFSSCDNSSENIKDKAIKLPKTFSMEIDDEYTDFDLIWSENACKCNIIDKFELEFVFDQRSNVLTVNMDGETYFDFEFDKNGHILRTLFPGDDVSGNIKYENNYKKFLWDLNDDGTVKGELIKGGMNLDVTSHSGEKQNIAYTYNELFITSLKMSGANQSVTFSPETDSEGNLNKLTLSTGSEEHPVNVTSSEITLSHSWQKLPPIFLIQYIMGMPAMLWATSSIVICYT